MRKVELLQRVQGYTESEYRTTQMRAETQYPDNAAYTSNKNPPLNPKSGDYDPRGLISPTYRHIYFGCHSGPPQDH
ncbi:hypothetical protein Trydic_g3424 [Trypoxylus dichotomus]